VIYKVKLTIDERGKLTGFDNGNPRDHTNMKSNTRKIFNGLALAILQSTGTIRIKAESNGLTNAIVEIPVISDKEN